MNNQGQLYTLEGFNLKLDYLPLNGADIVIRKPKGDVDQAEAVPELATA